jgi:hypothetical protein
VIVGKGASRQPYCRGGGVRETQVPAYSRGSISSFRNSEVSVSRLASLLISTIDFYSRIALRRRSRSLKGRALQTRLTHRPRN